MGRLLIKTWNDSSGPWRISERKTSILVATKRTAYQFVAQAPSLLAGSSALCRSLGWSPGQGSCGSPPLTAALCAGHRGGTGWPLLGGVGWFLHQARLRFSRVQWSSELVCLLGWARPSSLQPGLGKGRCCADQYCLVSLCSSESEEFSGRSGLHAIPKEFPFFNKSQLSSNIYSKGLENPFSPKPQWGTWLVPFTVTSICQLWDVPTDLEKKKSRSFNLPVGAGGRNYSSRSLRDDTRCPCFSESLLYRVTTSRNLWWFCCSLTAVLAFTQLSMDRKKNTEKCH